VLTNWPTIVTKKENLRENSVANSLAAWLPFDQLPCKFENIGGGVTPRRLPVGTSLATPLQHSHGLPLENSKAFQ